jgi:hypothetical protein
MFSPRKLFFIINQFTEIGYLCNQTSSGPPLSAEDYVEHVVASFLHSPNKSTGTAAKDISMLKIALWMFLHFGFLVINVCNHGEYYEQAFIYSYVSIYIRDINFHVFSTLFELRDIMHKPSYHVI